MSLITRWEYRKGDYGDYPKINIDNDQLPSAVIAWVEEDEMNPNRLFLIMVFSSPTSKRLVDDIMNDPRCRETMELERNVTRSQMERYVQELYETGIQNGLAGEEVSDIAALVAHASIGAVLTAVFLFIAAHPEIPIKAVSTYIVHRLNGKDPDESAQASRTAGAIIFLEQLFKSILRYVS